MFARRLHSLQWPKDLHKKCNFFRDGIHPHVARKAVGVKILKSEGMSPFRRAFIQPVNLDKSGSTSPEDWVPRSKNPDQSRVQRVCAAYLMMSCICQYISNSRYSRCVNCTGLETLGEYKYDESSDVEGMELL